MFVYSELFNGEPKVQPILGDLLLLIYIFV